MCGWPPARKRKVDVWDDGLLAVMCPAYRRGRMTAGPDGFRGLGPHQILGMSFPSLLQAAPGPSAQPTTPSRSFPRKRHEAVRLGLCGGGLPVTLPVRHDRPDDARRLVGKRHGHDEARSPGQQPLDPRVRAGDFRTEQDGLGADDQQLTEVLIPEPADPAQPRLAAGGFLPRHKAEPGRELPPALAGLGVGHGGGDRGRDQRPDARDGGEPQAERAGLVPGRNPVLDLGDARLPGSR